MRCDWMMMTVTDIGSLFLGKAYKMMTSPETKHAPHLSLCITSPLPVWMWPSVRLSGHQER